MERPALICERAAFVELMAKLGFPPDPWQADVLLSEYPQVLLNCCRQAGKSTVVAVLCLLEAMFKPWTTVILVSRTQRQSSEMLKLVKLYYKLLGERVEVEVMNANEIALKNLSRIISLPCREDTVRGYSHVDLLIIDEAARVPDDLYCAVRPMLAVSKGRLICLSTPHGKRGFFWDAWTLGGDDWQRFEVPASKVPRITAEFLEKEKRGLGDFWFRQEYCCSFEALEGLVYPDFEECVHPSPPAPLPQGERGESGEAVPQGERVGGMDFGFRNPFAAIWGHLDRDGILWLTGEHYARNQPLCFHASKLPRDVMWYADPAGASDIAALQYAGFRVRHGNNSKRPGIAAVSARVRNGTLRVLEGCCPNLLAEAGRYRYGEGEETIDEHNHALDALRYLISRLDARRLAMDEKKPPAPAPPAKPRVSKWLDVENEELWVPLRW